MLGSSISRLRGCLVAPAVGQADGTGRGKNPGSSTTASIRSMAEGVKMSGLYYLKTIHEIIETDVLVVGGDLQALPPALLRHAMAQKHWFWNGPACSAAWPPQAW